tara:strand:- start:2453 stop:3268 length:816 start_codon:yes stop_codon:yes gene_type:complete
MFRFISGNTNKCAITKANVYMNNNITPIINYAVENNSKYDLVYYEYKNLLEMLPKNYLIAIKLSSFNYNVSNINDIVNVCIDKKINLVVDAETVSNNNKYQSYVNDIIFNPKIHDSIKIYKTYQMYRLDSLDQIQKDINRCNKLNIPFNAKLVRGAYWNTEYNTGELFIDKHLTDKSYNNAILKVYNENLNGTPCNVILATHNTFSCEFGKSLNEKNIFEFAHLQGMRENYFKNMNEKVYVYIPYGPYHLMVPYMLRRLYENLSMVKYMII